MAENREQKLRTGSCLCGNVKYTLTGDPMAAFLCHCANCKKFTGAPFQGSGMFNKEQVSVQDPASSLKTYEDKANSEGNTLRRSFCSQCGSSMFIVASAAEHLFVVTVGTLDKGQTPWQNTVECYAQDSIGWTPSRKGVKLFQGDVDKTAFE